MRGKSHIEICDVACMWKESTSLGGAESSTTMSVLFHTSEHGIMASDARSRHRKDAAEGAADEHRLRGQPSGLVEELFYSFPVFPSLHYDAKVVRRNGTSVTPGIVRNAFAAFVPDGEQTV